MRKLVFPVLISLVLLAALIGASPPTASAMDEVGLTATLEINTSAATFNTPTTGVIDLNAATYAFAATCAPTFCVHASGVMTNNPEGPTQGTLRDFKMLGDLTSYNFLSATMTPRGPRAMDPRQIGAAYHLRC